MLYPYLPFPRGGTMSDWGALSNERPALTSATWLSLAGQRFLTADTVHGTASPVGLILLKNGASTLTVARRFLKFSLASALDFGRVSDGYNTVAGGIAVALDDAFVVGKVIPAYDLFYAVYFGPCGVLTEATTVNLAAGNTIISDASGYVDGVAAAATQVPLGIIDVASTTAAEEVVIHMDVSLLARP